MALLLFIDFEKNTIHTVRNEVFPRGMNDPVVGMPKTDSGTRYVPIAPELIKVLQPIGAHRCIIGVSPPMTLFIHRRMMKRIGRPSISTGLLRMYSGIVMQGCRMTQA